MSIALDRNMILENQNLQSQSVSLSNINMNTGNANNSGKGDKNKIMNINGAISSFRSSSEKVSSLPKTLKIFQLFINIEHSLGEFRRLLLPAFIKVLDDPDITIETRRITLCFLMHLANDTELHQFVPCIAHPLMRLLTNKNQKDPTMQNAAITALSCLVCRLGANYAPYVIPVRRKMKALPLREGGLKSSQIEEYETLVSRLLRQKSLPADPASATDIAIRYDNDSFEIVTYMLFKYPFSDLGYLYDRIIPCHTNIISCLLF